jgi:hypothetical protein
MNTNKKVKKPITEMRMSTSTIAVPVKKKKKIRQDVKVQTKVKTSAPVPTSSTSVVNTVKKKKRTVAGGEKRLNRVKEKALVEETAALELIARMKKKSEKSNEDDHLQVYMDMYTQLRRIIKRTEKGCMKSKTGQGAYQLATLYTQLRETIADIRNLTDLSDHADLLIEKVMRPLFTTMVQNTSNSMYTIKLKIKDKLREKRVRRTFEDIDEITIEAGKNLQDLYDRSCQDIKKILVGE